MKRVCYTMEILTPCFCAGANQSSAEIRAPAIRGALRWWFRALGGTREQEASVFGSVIPLRASAVQVRVTGLNPARFQGNLPEVRGTDPLSYILYFPSVAADKRRWTPHACIAPKSVFQLAITWVRPLEPEVAALLEKSILAFRHFGSIGMHATRGLGVLEDCASTEASFRDASKVLEQAGFVIRQSPAERVHASWKEALEEAGRWLQLNLRKEFGAGGNKKPPRPSALGLAQPRQASAVHLRFRRARGGALRFLAFEAPHRRVLGAESRKRHKEPILKSRDFSQSPPEARHQRGPRGGFRGGRR